MLLQKSRVIKGLLIAKPHDLLIAKLHYLLIAQLHAYPRVSGQFPPEENFPTPTKLTVSKKGF